MHEFVDVTMWKKSDNVNRRSHREVFRANTTVNVFSHTMVKNRIQSVSAVGGAFYKTTHDYWGNGCLHRTSCFPAWLYLGEDTPTLIKPGLSLLQFKQRRRRRVRGDAHWASEHLGDTASLYSQRRTGTDRQRREHTRPPQDPPETQQPVSGSVWRPWKETPFPVRLKPGHRVPMMSYLWILLLGSLLVTGAKAQGNDFSAIISRVIN